MAERMDVYIEFLEILRKADVPGFSLPISFPALSSGQRNNKE
jgi:hypothetical protein